jgi:hypothetical protein
MPIALDRPSSTRRSRPCHASSASRTSGEEKPVRSIGTPEGVNSRTDSAQGPPPLVPRAGSSCRRRQATSGQFFLDHLICGRCRLMPGFPREGPLRWRKLVHHSCANWRSLSQSLRPYCRFPPLVLVEAEVAGTAAVGVVAAAVGVVAAAGTEVGVAAAGAEVGVAVGVGAEVGVGAVGVGAVGGVGPVGAGPGVGAGAGDRASASGLRGHRAILHHQRTPTRRSPPFHQHQPTRRNITKDTPRAARNTARDTPRAAHNIARGTPRATHNMARAARNIARDTPKVLRNTTTRGTLRARRNITKDTLRAHRNITRDTLRVRRNTTSSTLRARRNITRGTLRAIMVARSNNRTMATSQQLIRATAARLTSQRFALTEYQSHCAPTDMLGPEPVRVRLIINHLTALIP